MQLNAVLEDYTNRISAKLIRDESKINEVNYHEADYLQRKSCFYGGMGDNREDGRGANALMFNS